MAVAVSVLALDFVAYSWHRANHRIPFLWRFHRVRHSDIAFTVSTGTRLHPGELLLSLPLRLAAVVLLGAPPEGVLLFELLFNIASLVEHGDTNVPVAVEGALARVFITPPLHRFHHSRRWVDLNTNFGTIFAVWDHLFGTYGASSSSTEVQTGLPGITGPTASAMRFCCHFCDKVDEAERHRSLTGTRRILFMGASLRTAAPTAASLC